MWDVGKACQFLLSSSIAQNNQSSEGIIAESVVNIPCRQKVLSGGIEDIAFRKMFANSSLPNRACLSVSTPHASDWLLAFLQLGLIYPPNFK